MPGKKMLVKRVHQVASTAHVTKYHTGVSPCMRACANVFPLTTTLSVYRRSIIGVDNWVSSSKSRTPDSKSGR